MAEKLSFKRVSTKPTSGMTKGDIYFVTGEKSIYVATGETTTEPYYGGVVKNVTYDTDKTSRFYQHLIVSYMDGRNMDIDFSDVASAEEIVQKFAALHLEGYTSTDGMVKETRVIDDADLVISSGNKLRFDIWVPSGDRIGKGISIGVLGQDGGEVSDTNPARIIDVANDTATGDVQVKGIETPITSKSAAGYDGSFVATREYVDGLTIAYDSTSSLIKLVSEAGDVLASFSAADFIKDGMLDGTALITATAASMEVTINGTKYTVTGLTSGQTYIVFAWNTAAGKSVQALNVTSLIEKYTLPIATATALGGVRSKATGTTANRDYNVQVNSDATMKVNVPWTDTHYQSGQLVANSHTEKDANQAAVNGSLRLNHIENNTVMSSHLIQGNNAIEVTSSGNGEIAIASVWAQF